MELCSSGEILITSVIYEMVCDRRGKKKLIMHKQTRSRVYLRKKLIFRCSNLRKELLYLIKNFTRKLIDE
jgi:hypothetical protein